MPSTSLDKSVFLVLGASGGIGECLCRCLVASGAKLIMGARGTGDKLASLADELGATPFNLDARNADEVQAAAELAVAEHGRLDGAANLVGSIFLKAAHRTSPREWQDTFDLNAGTAFNLVRGAAPLMKNSGGGSIVLMSSAAARVGLANHEAIAAAKAAVEGLMRSAASTYAPWKIRVNCIAPGLVRTPMSAGMVNSPVALRASEAMHPLGRIGEPQDIVSPLLWLLNPSSGWVTGQAIGVDGGLADLRGRAQA